MATTTAPPFQSTSLYVGDLAHDISEGHLFELFNMVGPVASIRVCRDAVTRRSLGYAYVNFHNPNDAERALDTLNNTQVKNGRSERPCRIMWSQRDPSVRKSGVGNIFIKNLDKTIDHKALYDTFSDFGNILSCKVAMDEHNQSKGYGFVHYETQEMADRAIEKVNGMSIADKEVFVGPFVPKKERLKHNANNFTNVFVKNIDPSVKDEEIHNLFSKFGQITSWVVTRDSDKGRVFGFLNFENHEASALAVEKVNGTEFKGKVLYVGRAQKKAERQAELRSKWEQMKSERAAKYQGVNLYIKNLDDDFDDEKLRKAFTPYGTITSAKVMTDDKGNSKGFGFVCFSTPEEANKCVPEMNGRVVGSKPLYVALAQRREERRAQLEAQHNAQRAKGRPFPGGNMQGAVYSSGAPLFYQGNMPPQQFVYQQQLVHRNRWAGPPPQAGPYQPMPPNYIMPPVARQPRNNVRQVPGGRRFNNQARNAREQPGVPVAIAQGGPAQIPGGDGVMPSAEPLTVDLLAQYSPEQQFLIASQRLYPMIHKAQPTLAPKITGMIRAAYLEHNQGPEELIRLLESPEALNNRIGAALEVWEAHVQESGKTDDTDADAPHIPTALVGDVSVAH